MSNIAEYYTDHFGHRIYAYSLENGKSSPWRYEDTNEIIDDNKPRKCPKCNLYPTKDDHDPCIANLPNVKYACCGHGKTNGAYISFENGDIIRDKEAIAYINKIKNNE